MDDESRFASRYWEDNPGPKLSDCVSRFNHNIIEVSRRVMPSVTSCRGNDSVSGRFVPLQVDVAHFPRRVRISVSLPPKTNLGEELASSRRSAIRRSANLEFSNAWTVRRSTSGRMASTSSSLLLPGQGDGACPRNMKSGGTERLGDPTRSGDKEQVRRLIEREMFGS